MEQCNPESMTTIDPTGQALSCSTAVLRYSIPEHSPNANDREIDNCNSLEVLFNPSVKHRLETMHSIKVAKGKLELLMDAVRQKKIVIAESHLNLLQECVDDMFLDL